MTLYKISIPVNTMIRFRTDMEVLHNEQMA